MASSQRKKPEIRQAPKHLEKMLYSNYREEGKLQQKLTDLTNSSRMRSLELDRQKEQVHNEMRLHKRCNSCSLPLRPASPPPLPPAPCPPNHIRKPSARENAEGVSDNRRSGLTSADPVNEYLLTEFRRVSEVIPGILNSLNKEDKGGTDGQEPVRRERRGHMRRASLAALEGSVLRSLTSPQVRLDPELKAFASKSTGSSGDIPDISKIVSMLSSIKALREDLAVKKRYEFTRSKTSFNDLLKNIHEEEHKGSQTDTYTDGACALLRRKMQKARRASFPTVDLSPGGEIEQHQRHLSASCSTLASVRRPNRIDGDDSIRVMLQEEGRQLTQKKVATEWQRYDDIRQRIDVFLREVVGQRQRCSLPVLSSNPERPEEAR